MRQDLDDHRIALDGILEILRSRDVHKLRALQELVDINWTASDIAAAIDHSMSVSVDPPIASSSRVTIDALTRMTEEVST